MAQSVPAAARRGSARDRSARGEGGGRAVPEPGRRATNRWRGVAGFTLLALGLGLLAEDPALLLASVAGVGFAAYAAVGRAPEPTLAVRRSVEEHDPAPEERVEVTVTVENEGDDAVPDLRVIDGVPDGLSVVEGSPRLATALRPGQRASLSYVVETDRGEHEFDPLTAVARDVAGATEYVRPIDEPTTITCSPRLPEDPPAFPLRPQTTRFTGRTTSEEGGSGVEFHATREYRPGDPLARIDWRRTARTQELTTVEYRRERAAAVLLVVDARPDAYVAPSETERSAVDRSVEAAIDVAADLLLAGHTVGLAAISPRSCWISPGRGPEHRVELRQTLATSPAFQRSPPSEDVNVYGAVRSIRERIASDTQVVLCSPLVDEDAVDAALRFEAHEHATTVVSPDPTTDETVGRQVADLSRHEWIASVRRAGVPVIDWRPDEPIERALARSRRRWSR